MIGEINMDKIVQITMDCGARHEVLEGSAFAGTMYSSGESSTLIVGTVNRDIMLELTASNLASYISVSCSREIPPNVIFDDLGRIALMAVQKSIEAAKTEADFDSEYNQSFLKASLEFVLRGLKG
jgi:hypothetical protein